MAGNIDSFAAFTTGNMKPSSGEQIDALWGQNISDNTGYLYYRPMLACCFGGAGILISSSSVGSYVGTAYFRKLPEYNHLIGSYVGTTSASGHLLGYINNSQFFSHGGAGSNWARGTSYDISGLDAGTWYPISFSVGHDAAGIAMLKGMSFWMDV